MEDQTKSDQATIASLRAQLAEEQDRNKSQAAAASAASAAAAAAATKPVATRPVAAKPAAPPQLVVPAAATTSFNNLLEAVAVDRKRVKDLKEVNDTLSALAADPSFQQGLPSTLYPLNTLSN